MSLMYAFSSQLEECWSSYIKEKKYALQGLSSLK